MEIKGMKKNDFLLLFGILFIAVICLGIQYLTPAGNGTLIIKVDGETIASYPLGEDAEFEINNGTNHVEILDGKVRMIQANCPDQICVHHKEISKNNETIVCLPNKVVLTIESREETEIDATTN